MSSFTGTLVGELLHSLKNNESEEKIVSIINRLEQLEKNAEKKVFEAETFERVQKYEMMNDNLILDENRAIAMGNYFFTDTSGNEVKVEYTFGYKLIDGNLKIDVHHSSFPYQH